MRKSAGSSAAKHHTKIRVLIAEDHPIMRQGLRVAVEAYKDLAVVGEAENGQEAVTLAERLKPDIVIMDIQMPVMDGIQATREITAANPTVCVIALSSFQNDDRIYQAIKAGAMGYFLKEISSEQLAEMVRAVHRGTPVLHPEIARRLMAEVRRPPLDATVGNETLTARETEILGYLARGFSNAEVARQLVISPRTVATHVGNILAKLHLANRTQAALYALDQGIAGPNDGASNGPR